MKTRKQISKEEAKGHNLKEALQNQGKGESTDDVENHDINPQTPGTAGNNRHTGRDNAKRH